MPIDQFFFPKRAVRLFCTAAASGNLSPRHTKDVLKYKDTSTDTDISPILAFRTHSNPWIRKNVVIVLGGMKEFGLIFAMAQHEEDRTVLSAILNQVVHTREGLEELVHLLESDDAVIREGAIAMFRRANRADCLISLLFADDDDLVNRVRGYMEKYTKE